MTGKELEKAMVENTTIYHWIPGYQTTQWLPCTVIEKSGRGKWRIRYENGTGERVVKGQNLLPHILNFSNFTSGV